MSEEKIKDISALYEAVESDSKEHDIKELAKLLISAMNDWPTYNQTSIREFIDELYVFYGKPITIDKIRSKDVDFRIPGNSWKAEAGVSILNLISIAKQALNTEDFEIIVKNIISFYSNK